jgi:rhodanese-related sulfurtransferase
VSCLTNSAQTPPAALLVDVRDAGSRSRVPIDGATVVDLADLPGWSAPGVDVVLVGNGLNQGELLAHCQQLRGRGVRATVIDGGATTVAAKQGASVAIVEAALVDADAVVAALRSEPGTALFSWAGNDSLEHALRVPAQPTGSAIREITQASGPRILVGDRPTAERWWSVLRGAGVARVFIYSGNVDALHAASAQLESVHQGRHWVAPTPCERQG